MSGLYLSETEVKKCIKSAGKSFSEALIFASINPQYDNRTSADLSQNMFCTCSFHGNSINNLLSYCGLIDAKIRASEKDLPVFLTA